MNGLFKNFPASVIALGIGKDLEQTERLFFAIMAGQSETMMTPILGKSIIDGRVEAEAKIAKLNADLDSVRKQLAKKSAEELASQGQLAILKAPITVDQSSFSSESKMTLTIDRSNNWAVEWVPQDLENVTVDNLTGADTETTEATLDLPDEGIWSATFVATVSTGQLAARRAVTISGQTAASQGSSINQVEIKTLPLPEQPTTTNVATVKTP